MFKDFLPAAQMASYAPLPADDDLTIITSRRITLELIIRRHVERQPNTEIRSGTVVRELLTSREPDGTIRVTGLTIEDADGRRDIATGLVVDAGGKGARLLEKLIKIGVPITEELESAGVLYFTRHYRLLPGVTEPPRQEVPASGDLGYLKFGVFPADGGCFSITLCVPEIELELRKAVKEQASFHAICLELPGLVPWLRPDVSEPVSKVIGMGDLSSRWRALMADGKPCVLGYIPLGDALIRTNPLYGRGCSFAAVSAGILGDALAASDDPATQFRLFATGIDTGLRPFFDHMREQDRTAIRRAQAVLTLDYRPRLKARLAKSFVDDGITIALRSDIGLMRQALRGFHMLEHPSAWLNKPGNMLRVLGYWARGKKANAAAYSPKPGPDRAEMMHAIGISPDTDMRTDWKQAA
ncbi:hypothetical protein GCM10011529_20040 [Polymorphobacter glacialis]|uniref:FAD-dependent oxidoreductase n=1 Tax=Sandarakinorhabdus glacialis TaxID=1614636 RepID=A0A916ZUR8_9SPHN|nr:hypothetical protein [Polymorphobacter glacialis]GGE13649.1 hypothetical protein GCM10011529_20040 [Polymorphobacter glacialis]